MIAWILSLSLRRWSSLNMLSLNLVSITSAFYLKLSRVLRTDRRKAKVRYCFIERTFGCPVWLRLVLCLDSESVSLKQWQGPLASALPVQAVTVRNSALTSAVTYPSPCHSTPTLKHARLAFALSLSFFCMLYGGILNSRRWEIYCEAEIHTKIAHQIECFFFPRPHTHTVLLISGDDECCHRMMELSEKMSWQLRKWLNVSDMTNPQRIKQQAQGTSLFISL